MFCERLSPHSSSSERPKRSETSSWIFAIETCASSPWGKTSLSTSWASSTDIARPPVARHHDLRAGLVERIEGVEELLLDSFLVLKELHVVDQEHVVGAVALLEALDPLVAQRVDEVVHERLARDVADGELARVLAH